MFKPTFRKLSAALSAALLLGLSSPAISADTPAAKAALTVTLVRATPFDLARTVSASGNIAAWEESSIAAETGGLRIVSLHANVGDHVKKGQTLAQLNSVTAEAELAQARAALTEARANQVQAAAEAERARQLRAAGMMSASQANAQITAESTAAARVASAEAMVKVNEVKVAQTRILAPDDGVISARNAAVGTFAGTGQELFRMIRQGRLEWRAEVAATELVSIKPGQEVTLISPAGKAVPGKVRSLAPSVDPRSRNGIVYVDLDTTHLQDARAGMFARGDIRLGRSNALTVPQTAVLLRDGFSYVYRVDAKLKVSQIKVETGRRSGDRVEILKGVDAQANLVASGLAFLADGDTVKVANPAPAAKR
ncbi:efflux RND transporter periplasmic adaptor subunit [Burkholderiaceae bacterium DAT-1]|nr:efflux RND transporter periplasmic adaptor subunit [Burkholderiaceae bacterium DAT-1]